MLNTWRLLLELSRPARTLGFAAASMTQSHRRQPVDVSGASNIGVNHTDALAPRRDRFTMAMPSLRRTAPDAIEPSRAKEDTRRRRAFLQNECQT